MTPLDKKKKIDLLIFQMLTNLKNIKEINEILIDYGVDKNLLKFDEIIVSKKAYLHSILHEITNDVLEIMFSDFQNL